MKLSISVKLKE